MADKVNEKHDWKAAMEADRKARIEMFGAALDVLRKQYRCDLQVQQMYVNGQPGPIQLVILATE